ncbi:hypothetical protein [Aquimarina algiphila]|uniref:hypothetical protein n=1 Tax=Aquimarina algiphila TaxID=2047982 RepID=UPI00232BA035|nr:hypothetical protein [Aquimarina algiphila]
MTVTFTSEFDALWYVFWGKNYYNEKMGKLIKSRIMRYKVIDAKSQYFGKILDFESCSTLSDLGGVLLKIERNRVSLFKFNEVELV